jgi:flagellar motility protein MotE (MotC chaperone)
MKEKKLTREQARELYDDLHKAMSQMMAKEGKPSTTPQAKMATSGSPEMQSKAAKEIAQAIKAGLNGKASAIAAATIPAGARDSRARGGLAARMAASRGGSRPGRKAGGQAAALMVMGLFCMAKVVISGIEASGIADVAPAEAAMVAIAPMSSGQDWSKEEAKVLTALDHRRAELEERSGRVDQREMELTARDRDVAVRLNELKELTDRLKIEREKGDKQRSTQLDQLANVYGSMNPPEAAQLLQQLDIQVALSLIQRMPEKRMGQILALMTPQRALDLTNLLSQRGTK